MRGAKLTNELLQKELEQKSSIEEIMRIYNVSRGCVERRIKRHKLVYREYKNTLTKLFLEKEYLVNKRTTKNIAKQFGVSDVTIVNWLKKYEIKRAEPSSYLKGRTLSQAHKDKIRKNAPRGVDHPLYGKRGSLAPCYKRPEDRKQSLYSSIRKSTRYKEWRMAVFTRDNFKCTNIECDGKDKTIIVDHIIPFAVIVNAAKLNADNLDTKINSVGLLWDPDNGRTLCNTCHIKTPTFAGGTKRILKEGTKMLSELFEDIEKLYVEKQSVYGHVDKKILECLKQFYPNGIPVNAYEEFAMVSKILEKLSRITNPNIPQASKNDAYKDLAGYSMLQLAKSGNSIDVKHPSIPTEGVKITANNEEFAESVVKVLNEELDKKYSERAKLFAELKDVFDDLQAKKTRCFIRTIGPLKETNPNFTLSKFGRIVSVNYNKDYMSLGNVALDHGYLGADLETIHFDQVLEIEAMDDRFGKAEYKTLWTHPERIELNKTSSFDHKFAVAVDKLQQAISDPSTQLWAQVQQAMDDQGVEKLSDLKDDLSIEGSVTAQPLPKSIEEKAVEIQEWLSKNTSYPTADEITVWQTLPSGVSYAFNQEALVKLLSAGDIVRFKDLTKLVDGAEHEWEVERVLDSIVFLKDDTDSYEPNALKCVDLTQSSNTLQKKIVVKFKSEQDKKNWLELAKTSVATPDQVVDKLIDMYKLQTEETVLARAKERNHKLIGYQDISSVDSDREDAVCSDHDAAYDGAFFPK